MSTFTLIPIIYLSVFVIFLTILNIYVFTQIRSWRQYQIKIKTVHLKSLSIQEYGNITLYSLYIQNLNYALIALYSILGLSDQDLCVNNTYYNLAMIYSTAQQINIAKLYYHQILNNDAHNQIVIQKYKIN